MPDVVFNPTKVFILNADIDFSVDTLKLLLVTSSYSPNIDSHDFRNDITNEVANGNGYTTGGATLSGVSVTQDSTDDEAVVDASDVSWTSSTITARGGVLYKSRGGASSADELIAYFDFGSDKSSSNGTFTVAWAAEGILNLG